MGRVRSSPPSLFLKRTTEFANFLLMTNRGTYFQELFWHLTKVPWVRTYSSHDGRSIVLQTNVSVHMCVCMCVHLLSCAQLFVTP